MFRSKTVKMPTASAVMTAPAPAAAAPPAEPAAPPAMLTVDDHPEYRAAQQIAAELRARRARIAEQLRTENAKGTSPVEGADPAEFMIERAIASDPSAPAAPLDELREQYGLLGEALRRAEVECGQARKTAARELADTFREHVYPELEDRVARAKFALRVAEHERDDFLLQQDVMVMLELRGFTLDRDCHRARAAEIQSERAALNAW